MRRRGKSKKDANHDEVANCLRQIGCQVLDTHDFWKLQPGWPDLTVRFRGELFLIEVKTERGKLTDAEKDFDLFFGPVYVVRSGREAVDLILELVTGG